LIAGGSADARAVDEQHLDAILAVGPHEYVGGECDQPVRVARLLA
jgi:hypothetical protein